MLLEHPGYDGAGGRGGGSVGWVGGSNWSGYLVFFLLLAYANEFEVTVVIRYRMYLLAI